MRRRLPFVDRLSSILGNFGRSIPTTAIPFSPRPTGRSPHLDHNPLPHPTSTGLVNLHRSAGNPLGNQRPSNRIPRLWLPDRPAPNMLCQQRSQYMIPRWILGHAQRVRAGGCGRSSEVGEGLFCERAGEGDAWSEDSGDYKMCRGGEVYCQRPHDTDTHTGRGIPSLATKGWIAE